MGNATNKLYSNQDMLYYHIQKRSYDKVSLLIKQQPQLLEKILTKQSKHTPLMRAVYVGDQKMVDLILQFNPNINFQNKKGETALIIAVKRNQFHIVKRLFLEKQINGNLEATIQVQKNHQIKLKAIDYAILAGFYDIAYLLFQNLNKKNMKETQSQLKSVRQYEQLGKKYNYRYVNYDMVITSLLQRRTPQEMGNYLKKHKIILKDPVIDPRQPWKDWIKRVAQFKDAPLIQRDQLPQELQPQNRLFGKVHHYADSFIRTPGKQKSVIHPSSKAMSEMGELDQNGNYNNKNQATKMELINPRYQCQSEVN